MTHPDMVSRHITTAQCGHLRHKSMYVLSDPAPEPGGFADEIDATAFWCACTQKAFGPDGRPVNPAACAAGRECCDHS